MRDFISFRRDEEHSETAGTHRWMVSYADFVTLLFVLFLVLYAGNCAKLPEASVPGRAKTSVRRSSPAYVPIMRRRARNPSRLALR